MDFAESTDNKRNRATTATSWRASRFLVMRVLVWSFIAFALTFVYKVFPQTNVLRNDLIPFRPDKWISIEGHCYYACEHLRWVIVSYLFYYCSETYKGELENYRLQLRFFFILFMGFLIDYMLYYNGTLFTFYFIPVSYSLVMALLMCFTIIKTIWSNYR